MNSREIQVIFIIKYCFPIKLKSHINSCGIACIKVIPHSFFKSKRGFNPFIFILQEWLSDALQITFNIRLSLKLHKNIYFCKYNSSLI